MKMKNEKIYITNNEEPNMQAILTLESDGRQRLDNRESKFNKWNKYFYNNLTLLMMK